MEPRKIPIPEERNLALWQLKCEKWPMKKKCISFWYTYHILQLKKPKNSLTQLENLPVVSRLILMYYPTTVYDYCMK